MMEKTLEQKWKEGINRHMDQNQLLHAIFTMTKLQAKITLCMIMYGADLNYSVGAALRICPKN